MENNSLTKLLRLETDLKKVAKSIQTHYRINKNKSNSQITHMYETDVKSFSDCIV